MPKELKLKLDDLTVTSFVTTLEKDTKKDIKGGAGSWRVCPTERDSCHCNTVIITCVSGVCAPPY